MKPVRMWVKIDYPIGPQEWSASVTTKNPGTPRYQLYKEAMEPRMSSRDKVFIWTFFLLTASHMVTAVQYLPLISCGAFILGWLSLIWRIAVPK